MNFNSSVPLCDFLNSIVMHIRAIVATSSKAKIVTTDTSTAMPRSTGPTVPEVKNTEL